MFLYVPYHHFQFFEAAVLPSKKWNKFHSIAAFDAIINTATIWVNFIVSSDTKLVHIFQRFLKNTVTKNYWIAMKKKSNFFPFFRFS